MNLYTKIKHFIIMFLLCVILLFFTACSNMKNNDATNPSPPPSQSTEDNDNSNDNNSNESLGEEKPSVPPEEIVPVVQKETMIYSNTNSLIIRSGAGTNYYSVGSLDKGDLLLYKGKSGSWYKTVYKGKTAYVSSSYSYLTTIEKTNDRIEKVLAIAYETLGYPYLYGAQRYHFGNGNLNYSFVMGKFDCSSLMQYIFYKADKTLLNMTTRTQVSQGQAVSSKNLQRGDLMFFTNETRYNLSGNERIGHVALYLGDNYILHTASDHAVIEQISAQRWKYYICSRRV